MGNLRMTMPVGESDRFLLEGRYQRRPTSKRWKANLQEWCFRILDWLGCQAYDTESTYRTVEFDFDNLIEGLADIAYQINGLWMYPKQTYLLIGPEWYAEMIKDSTPATWDATATDTGYRFLDPTAFENPIRRSWYNSLVGERKVLGLTVVLVPWMTGPPLVIPAIEDIHTYGMEGA